MKINLYNKNLEVSEQIDLNPKIFEVTPEIELVQQAVRTQMSNARDAVSNTKTRGEVRGGGKKPWKQKGTGNARAGSIRSPLWRHGGVTFGPRGNRNYSLKMNKKQSRKALYMVLSDKAADQKFLVFSDFSLENPKTKDMVAMLANIHTKIATTSKKFLVVLPAASKNIDQASRNIKNAKVIMANSLNILDLLKYDSVLLPRESLQVIEKTYLK